MRIWYVGTKDQEWDDAHFAIEDKFFSCETTAYSFLKKKNSEEKARWEASQVSHKERWDLTELAYDAMTRIGLDADKVFPYHRRDYSFYEFDAPYIIKEIEVI